MPIELTERFRDAYLRLPPSIQRKVDKALTLLDANPRYPGLHAKPIQGTPGVYEARVDQKYRMSYERHGDVFLMRNVGAHDPTIEAP